MPDEFVSVRISLQDAITAGLLTVEHQAKETRDALSNMEDRKLSDSLDSTTKKVAVQEKGLRKLRLGAMDLGFAFKAIKIPAIAVAITQATSAISSMTAGLTGMIGQLAPASGLIGALPAGITALVSSMAVVKLAFGGVSDAISTMMKEGATVDEVNKALKDLSPSAKAFAKAVAGLKPHIKTLREGVQAALLPHLTTALRMLVPLFDDVKAALVPLAHTLGGVAEEGAKMLRSGPFRADFKTIMGRNNTLVKTLGTVLLRFVDIIRNVMVAAGPMVQRLADSLGGAALRLQQLTQRGRDMGTLEKFFTHAYETAARLGRTLMNFVRGLFNIFKLGQGLGDDMNNSLETMSKKFRDWTESASGQQKITKWFEDARPVLHELALLVRDVFKAFAQFDAAGRTPGAGIVETIRAVRTQLLPALTSLISGVGGQLGPAIVDILTALTKLLDFSSFSPLIVILKTLGAIANFLVDLGGSSPAAHAAATAFVSVGLAVKLAMTAFSLGSKAVEYFGKKITEAKRMADAFGSAISRAANWIRTFGGPGGALDGMKLRLLYAKDAIVKFWQETVVANAKLLVTKVRMAAIKAMDMARFLADMALAWLKVTIEQVKQNAALLVTWIRTKAVYVWQKLVAAATWLWAAAQWALNVAMDANPIGLIVLAIAALVAGVIYAYTHFDWFRSAIDSVWQAIQKAWDLMLRFKFFLLAALFPAFAPILLVIANFDKLKTAVGWVVDRIKDLVEWFGHAIEKAGDLMKKVRNIPGISQAITVGSWVNPFGDTATPRGRSGNLAHTLGAHGAIGASTPGKQYVTNVSYGAYKGSDHVAGRALDLVGSGLNAYAKQVRAFGGYAAHHGSGPSRHLHAVYGDTARPRGGNAASAPEQLVLQAPLIGTVYAREEVDVDRAVSRALNQWIRDRNERR